MRGVEIEVECDPHRFGERKEQHGHHQVRNYADHEQRYPLHVGGRYEDASHEQHPEERLGNCSVDDDGRYPVPLLALVVMLAAGAALCELVVTAKDPPLSATRAAPKKGALDESAEVLPLRQRFTADMSG